MPEAAAHVQTFEVHQKVKPIANEYRAIGADGELLAFAKQKKMKLKEEVEFFSEEGGGDLLFRMKSRQVMDVHSTTDVMDAGGAVLGSFTRKFAASLLKSTWNLEYGDVAAVGTEASTGKAIARRFGVPLRFDYIFTDTDGTEVLRIHRELALRDKYTVTIPDERLPFAVAVGMTVAQDAFDDR